MKSEKKLKRICLLRNLLLALAVVLALACAVVGGIWLSQRQETGPDAAETAGTEPTGEAAGTESTADPEQATVPDETASAETDPGTAPSEAETTVPDQAEVPQEDPLTDLLNCILESEDTQAVIGEIEDYAGQHLDTGAADWQEDIRQRCGLWFDGLAENGDAEAQETVLEHWDRVSEIWSNTLHHDDANALVKVLEEFFAEKRQPAG